jgi:tetratricopeptide (TPR) repeat protein
MTRPLSAATAQSLNAIQALIQAGQLEQAQLACRQLLKRERGCSPAAEILAEILLGQGAALEAEALLRPFCRKEGASFEIQSLRAAALKTLGDKAGSLAQYQAAAKLAANDPIAAHNIAAGFGDLGRDQDAVAQAERALRLGGRAPETLLVLGRGLQGLRQFDRAKQAFEAALSLRPNYAEALRDLSHLIWMSTGDAAAALAPVDQALAQAPKQANAQGDLLLVKLRLLSHIHGEAAALALARTEIAAIGQDPRLALEFSWLLLKDNPADALAIAQQLVARFPSERLPKKAVVQALLALGDAKTAADLAFELVAEQPGDQQAIADLTSAWRLSGDPRLGDLYDYPAVVQALMIDCPAGWTHLTDFLDDLRTSLNSVHLLKAHPIEQSIRGGSQTSHNLVTSDDPVIAAFFQAIQGPIRAYRDHLGQGPDLLRRRNVGGHRIDEAWSVRLRPQGFHVDHIHPNGWISSAFYADVPPQVQTSDRHEGWLRLGAPPTPTAPTLEAGHFVQPKPGLLALFPSYMWHGTVPFGGAASRMSLAFDVLPGAQPR